MPETPPSIGRLAAAGVAWAIVQSWGGRIITFLLFVLLARFLEPAAFGVASVAVIVLGLVTLVAEFGFCDALVQRRELEPADVDLPFFASLAGSVMLAALIALFAGRIETGLGVAGLSPVLIVMVSVAPLTIASRFQEASYRRALVFRDLAFRVLVANLLGGAAAVAAAAAGFGVWSLVVQAYVVALVGLVWLWRRPVWRPTGERRPASFAAFVRFGLPLTTLRLAEFAAVRFYEVILIGRFGVAAYGLYAVGARLYETFLSLLQGAMNELSLTLLSRISHDRDRLAEAYLRTLVFAGFLTAPIFVALAALIPEIAAVLFGSRWAGVDAIARPLLLLGALQALYNFNGSFLAARGRPTTMLSVQIVRSLAIPLAVVFVPTADVVDLVRVFVLAQLVEAPFSFAATLREVGLSPKRLAADLLPAVFAALAGTLAVAWTRPLLIALVPAPLPLGLLLGVVFVVAFAAVAAILGRRQIALIRGFLADRLARR
jgi:O-antigen/teichoic acid export membrane protein